VFRPQALLDELGWEKMKGAGRLSLPQARSDGLGLESLQLIDSPARSIWRASSRRCRHLWAGLLEEWLLRQQQHVPRYSGLTRKAHGQVKVRLLARLPHRQQLAVLLSRLIRGKRCLHFQVPEVQKPYWDLQECLLSRAHKRGVMCHRLGLSKCPRTYSDNFPTVLQQLPLALLWYQSRLAEGMCSDRFQGYSIVQCHLHLRRLGGTLSCRFPDVRLM
jgi:hypothetical protein